MPPKRRKKPSKKADIREAPPNNKTKENTTEQASETTSSAQNTSAGSLKASTSWKGLHWLLLSSVVLVIGAVWCGLRFLVPLPSCLTPLEAPLAKDCGVFDDAYRTEMLWGTYRPGVYFGMRARLPSSLLVGLMWMDPTQVDNFQRIRHLAIQEDGTRYGWSEHNGRNFGIQKIHDAEIQANITTSWISKSNDWSVRVSVEGETGKDVALFFYIVDESGPDTTSANLLDWELLDEPPDPHGQHILRGKHSVLGKWDLAIHSADLKRLKLYKAGFPVTSYHNLTEIMSSVLYDSLMHQYTLQEPKDVSKLEVRLHEPQLWLESAMEHPNFAVFQIVGTPPFTFDVAFVNSAFSPSRFDSLVASDLDSLLTHRRTQFKDAFDKRWPVIGKKRSEAEKEAMFGALSNMLGGIGYFYGSSKVRVPPKSQNAEPVDRESFKSELFSAVPSRSFFPRGFLWDEGFHLLLIQRWDALLCKDILAHWLDLMDADGWIPREQILGDEARSRVPSEFVVQDPSIGNPPTLFLPLLKMAEEKDGPSLAFLRQSWPRLVKWFEWILQNHRGKQPITYKWTSRVQSSKTLNPLTLDSGLDDYPRASHPSEEEYHLDIRCWIGFAATAMSTIAKSLELPTTEIDVYENLARELNDVKLLKKLHYDAKRGWFSDFGLHTESVRLENTQLSTPGNSDEERVVRVVDDVPSLQFISHFGYVSLFPFFMKLLPPQDPILFQQLQLIEDRNLLWTDYGLRSLARISSLYQKRNTEHDPPYWRGAIWINMNSLALESLQYYSRQQGPYAAHAADLYTRLRENIVRNIVSEFQRTGFLWEQYDDETGEGKGCRPFTGWTALFLLTTVD